MGAPSRRGKLLEMGRKEGAQTSPSPQHQPPAPAPALPAQQHNTTSCLLPTANHCAPKVATLARTPQTLRTLALAPVMAFAVCYYRACNPASRVSASAQPRCYGYLSILIQGSQAHTRGKPQPVVAACQRPCRIRYLGGAFSAPKLHHYSSSHCETIVPPLITHRRHQLHPCHRRNRLVCVEASISASSTLQHH
jgi:hypothetical protein